MYRAEIVFSHGNGWDSIPRCSLLFSNERRLRYFVRRYTAANDCLIRVYYGTWWVESWVKGEDIWNVY